MKKMGVGINLLEEFIYEEVAENLYMINQTPPPSHTVCVTFF